MAGPDQVPRDPTQELGNPDSDRDNPFGKLMRRRSEVKDDARASWKPSNNIIETLATMQSGSGRGECRPNTLVFKGPIVFFKTAGQSHL